MKKWTCEEHHPICIWSIFTPSCSPCAVEEISVATQGTTEIMMQSKLIILSRYANYSKNIQIKWSNVYFLLLNLKLLCIILSYSRLTIIYELIILFFVSVSDVYEKHLNHIRIWAPCAPHSCSKISPLFVSIIILKIRKWIWNRSASDPLSPPSRNPCGFKLISVATQRTTQIMTQSEVILVDLELTKP
jgi:hypothetical protein